MKTYDLVVIGGGSAGLSAALSAYDNGIKNILLLIMLGISAYAFSEGEQIVAIYFALMYICLRDNKDDRH